MLLGAVVAVGRPLVLQALGQLVNVVDLVDRYPLVGEMQNLVDEVGAVSQSPIALPPSPPRRQSHRPMANRCATAQHLAVVRRQGD